MRFFLTTIATLCIFALSAQAEDASPPAATKCSLTELASLPLTMGDGKLAMPTVSAAIDGSPVALVAGLAQPSTAISKEVANANRIETDLFSTQGKFPVLMYVGGMANATGVVPKLTIGAATFDNVSALVMTPSKNGDGVLGLDVLSHMDIELNLRAGKINLFSQDHCPGQAVYWGRPYVTLPFALDERGIPVFRMQLDGKAVTAKLDITKDEAVMGGGRQQFYMGLRPRLPASSLETILRL